MLVQQSGNTTSGAPVRVRIFFTASVPHSAKARPAVREQTSTRDGSVAIYMLHLDLCRVVQAAAHRLARRLDESGHHPWHDNLHAMFLMYSFERI